jgi:hypothetical protein
MARWIGSFFVAAIIVAGLVFYGLRDDFSPKEQSPAAVVEDSSNKLRLELPKKQVQRRSLH